MTTTLTRTDYLGNTSYRVRVRRGRVSIQFMGANGWLKARRPFNDPKWTDDNIGVTNT